MCIFPTLDFFFLEKDILRMNVKGHRKVAEVEDLLLTYKLRLG